jgi:protein-disulfide isomerase
MSRKSKRKRRNGEPATPSVESNRRLTIVYACVAVLVLAIVAGGWLYQRQQSPAGGAAEQAALLSADSPTLGDATAKVHVVEFMDPACGTCALFFPLVKQVMAENPGRIRLSVRQVGFHNGSDYVVRLLEASRKQDRYWQTLETLLATQSQWAPDHTVQPELVGVVIEGLGLNVEQLRIDMNSPEVEQRVQRDLRDAMTMKVTATPEYFVNGRPLPSFGEQQLLDLVHEELQRAY